MHHFDINEFENQLEYAREQHKDRLNKERLSKIHDDVITYYNSLNVLCGPQGSGKSYSAMKEAAKISQVDEYAHLLVVICKPENQDDPTVTMFKELLHIPIKFVTEDTAEEYIRELFEYKRLYNQIKDEHLEDKIMDEQVEELCMALHINDLSKPWLHTLIIVNDSAKSKLFKVGSYFSHLIAVGRHTQTSTFLNIQFWKGLTPEVKANISSAFIFGGYSRQQLTHILSQLPSQYDYKEIYPTYRQLNKQDKMIFCDGEVMIETSNNFNIS